MVELGERWWTSATLPHFAGVGGENGDARLKRDSDNPSSMAEDRLPLM